MHAVRRSLVEAQAERVGLPLWPIEIPSPCPNAVYEEAITEIWQRAVAEHAREIAFGDLFLQDVRDYRERQLRATGLRPLFPLWHLPTYELAREMIRARMKAKIACLDPAKLDRSFAGQEFDDAFLDLLPPTVDPCGENGEFHTFVYESPEFTRPISIKLGETIERDGFVFTDVLSKDGQKQLDADQQTTTYAGLCATCVNKNTVVSDRGSVFYRCMLADKHPEFAKYPRLPVLTCPGWRPTEL